MWELELDNRNVKSKVTCPTYQLPNRKREIFLLNGSAPAGKSRIPTTTNKACLNVHSTYYDSILNVDFVPQAGSSGNVQAFLNSVTSRSTYLNVK